jgi:hypothetical protein
VIVTYFFQRLVQTLLVNGLENIVKRIGLESLYCILVIGCQEKNNRHGLNVELSHDLADHRPSVILDQVRNGVAIRMAVLYLLLGASEEADL